jgi:hypothetical protein
MKLRLQQDSIRLRLTRSEVEKLAAHGRVEGAVHFGSLPGDSLTYALEASPSCSEISARRASNEVCIVLPQELARDWAATDQVSIEHLQVLARDAALHILVEKDFRCAHRDVAPKDENEGDFYPNPMDTVTSPD